MNKLSDISADGFSLFIVGPQSSGKTIYLMGLSLLERKKGSHFKKSYKVDFSFRPTREGLEKSTPEEKLRDDAERTLFSQTPAAPTERLEKECSFSGKIQYGETEAKFVLLISDTPGELLKGKYKEIEENIQKNDIYAIYPGSYMRNFRGCKKSEEINKSCYEQFKGL